ncbi:MAG: diacylglycerol kinase [Saprospiraceae bacterium]|nr:MAG: diacylglycerol kinase [Saprospiraceae bacterium]
MPYCSTFIATSLDGYIADRNGGVDFLEMIPNPDRLDMGYVAFNEKIDALLMGRKSFETVCGFDVPWPYDKPVFVLSNTLRGIPEEYSGKAFLMSGKVREVLDELEQRGYHRLYIDGGKTIQSFLEEDLIEEMIITVFPVLLGGGIPLFGELENPLEFDLVNSQVYLDQLVQLHYRRKRST